MAEKFQPEFYNSSLLSKSLKAEISSLVIVTPFPIFWWSGDQLLISYFAGLSPQDTMFSSVFHPAFDSERTQNDSVILNEKSSAIFYHLFVFYGIMRNRLVRKLTEFRTGLIIACSGYFC